MDNKELVAQLNAIKAENEALKAKIAQGNVKKERSLSFRVSEKKALSIYGLGRFPVTMYANQWRRLLAVAKDIEQFITDNQVRLAFEKPEGHVTAIVTTPDATTKVA